MPVSKVRKKKKPVLRAPVHTGHDTVWNHVERATDHLLDKMIAEGAEPPIIFTMTMGNGGVFRSRFFKNESYSQTKLDSETLSSHTVAGGNLFPIKLNGVAANGRFGNVTLEAPSLH